MNNGMQNNGLFSPHVAQMPQAGQGGMPPQMPPQMTQEMPPQMTQEMPPQMTQEMGTQEGAPKYSVGDPTLDRYINLFLV